MNQELAELDAEIEQELQAFQKEHCILCGSQRCDGSFDFASGCKELANYLHDKYKNEEYLKDPEEWENY